MANSHQKLGQFVGRGFQSRPTHICSISRRTHMPPTSPLEPTTRGSLHLWAGSLRPTKGYTGWYLLQFSVGDAGSRGDAPSTAVEALKDYLQWIEANRKDISDRSVIQNQIDTVVELLASTIYKLENLS